jgi:hypothetical protein
MKEVWSVSRELLVHEFKFHVQTVQSSLVLKNEEKENGNEQ